MKGERKRKRGEGGKADHGKDVDCDESKEGRSRKKRKKKRSKKEMNNRRR